jgi:ketosteroid isomerase-like protein
MLNRDVVGAVLEAYFSGDEAGWRELLHPEVVVTQFPEQADARPYHGHDGAREVITDWVDTWDDYSVEVLGVRDLSDRHVLVSLHQSGRGKGSGLEVEGDAFFLWTVEAGKVTRLQMFSSEHEAVEAAASA